VRLVSRHRGELYARLVGCCMAATNQAGLEREVELFQLFVVWQPRQLQRVAEPTALAEADICFQEWVDEVRVLAASGG
jgi:hypothetical protein